MPRSTKPNILFFFADDQRYNTIGALGNPHVKTPNIDELVRRGIAFTHAHIPGGTSGAVCMPSRAMLHSGRTLFSIEHEGQNIPEAHCTIGEAFRKAGYETFGTGKWHNGSSSFARSFSCGDDIFYGGMHDHWNVPLHRFDPTGAYAGRLPQVRDWEHDNEVIMRSGDHLHAGVHSTEIFADAAINFLQSYSNEKPFFAYVSLMAPHDPRTMPERFREMYRMEDIPLPGNFLPECRYDVGTLRHRDEKLASYPRKPDEMRRHLLEYYAMISHLDDGLGRVIEAMKKSGCYENTIIVFSADNGLAVGSHGLMGKQNLYDHSVRVPLVFAGPGIPAGQQRDAWVYLLDIFPTLCDLAGIAKPQSVNGISFAPSISGKSASHRDALYLAFLDTTRGVKSGRHKLIEYAANGRRYTELFDIVSDPLECKDLSIRPEHAGTIASLRKKLVELRDEWGDRSHPLGEKFWNAFGS